MNIKCKWKGREDESSSFWWKMILIAVGRLKYENVNLISSEKKSFCLCECDEVRGECCSLKGLLIMLIRFDKNSYYDTKEE